MQNTAKEIFEKIKNIKDLKKAAEMVKDPEERKKILLQVASYYTGKALTSAKNTVINYFKK